MFPVPVEIWYLIIDELPAQDVASLRTSCKTLDTVITPILWKNVALVFERAPEDKNKKQRHVGMTIDKMSLWKLHKILGMEKCRQRFELAAEVLISMSFWKEECGEDGAAEVVSPPHWCSSAETHIEWVLPLLPSLLKNAHTIHWQLYDFRPRHAEWHTTVPHLVASFSRKQVHHVTIIYKANMRMHMALPTIHCDTLSLDLTHSPITRMELLPISSRVRHFQIDSIWRNHTELLHCERAFRNAVGLDSLMLSVQISSYDWIPKSISYLKVQDLETCPNHTITLPKLKTLQVDVVSWNALECFNCPQLSSLIVRDMKQRVSALECSALTRIASTLQPANVLLCNVSQKMCTDLSRIWNTAIIKGSK